MKLVARMITLALVSAALLPACGKAKPAATAPMNEPAEETQAAPDDASQTGDAEDKAESAGKPAPDGSDPCGGGE